MENDTGSSGSTALWTANAREWYRHEVRRRCVDSDWALTVTRPVVPVLVGLIVWAECGHLYDERIDPRYHKTIDPHVEVSSIDGTHYVDTAPVIASGSFSWGSLPGSGSARNPFRFFLGEEVEHEGSLGTVGKGLVRL
jgi:hypothetical protein